MFPLDLNHEYWNDINVDGQEEESDTEERLKNLEEINRKWNEQMALVDNETDCVSNKIGKTVHFPSESQLAHIYPMITWSYAYQEDCGIEGERLGDDAQRIRNQIRIYFSSILHPILKKERSYAISKRLQAADMEIVQCVKYTHTSKDFVN